jgi:hypothetical protein
MAFLNFRKHTRRFVPASYTADATTAMFNVAPGDLISYVFARTEVVFNGGGTDAIVTLGDGADVDRFILAGDVDETTAGLYAATGGTGSAYLLLGHHLYTATDTIDVVFTANTSGSRTTGEVLFVIHKAKVNP